MRSGLRVCWLPMMVSWSISEGAAKSARPPSTRSQVPMAVTGHQSGGGRLIADARRHGMLSIDSSRCRQHSSDSRTNFQGRNFQVDDMARDTLFSILPAELSAGLIAQASIVTLAPDQTLFAAGAACDGGYHVIEG